MAQGNHTLKTIAVAFGTAVMVGACTAPGLYRSPEGPPPPGPSPPAGLSAPAGPSPPSDLSPPARVVHLSPATRSLVTRARAQVSRGDLPAASSTLDRALRIEPNNPLLWVELGRLRLMESDAHQAEGCARKALALASGDLAAQRQSGRLLADALRAQRRNQEARELESQPFMK